MTRTRRILTFIGLTAAITVADSLPASAGFSETVAAATSVATGTVAPPTSVRVDDYCTRSWTYNYRATVSWKASTTARGVIGYRVIAHLNNGTSVVMAETNATTTSISATVDQYYLPFQPRVSVTTLPSYGWTAESPKTAVLTC
jgi:hypothetical protein